MVFTGLGKIIVDAKNRMKKIERIKKRNYRRKIISMDKCWTVVTTFKISINKSEIFGRVASWNYLLLRKKPFIYNFFSISKEKPLCVEN
jgi:hypothetical protein